MNQLSFSDIEYSNRRRTTKREEFLNSMDKIIPWAHWIGIIQPYYYNNKRGRKPISIEVMLRMYLMQNWFNLSDEGMEEAIYDSYAMRSFLKINFIDEQVPDATTLLKFRHLLEKHHIGEKIFQDVNDRLEKAGLIMHQTKKGNQWYHGMKVHAGVDAGSGYVHTITGTAANVHDIDETANLLREDDEVCYGDSGYSGAEKRPEIQNNEHFRDIEFRTNVRPSSLKISSSYTGFNWDKEIENRKSSVRCKVEHPFLIVKRQFGYAKVVYRGIAKNMNRFHILFASANLVKCFRAGRTDEFCMV